MAAARTSRILWDTPLDHIALGLYRNPDTDGERQLIFYVCLNLLLTPLPECRRALLLVEHHEGLHALMAAAAAGQASHGQTCSSGSVGWRHLLARARNATCADIRLARCGAVGLIEALGVSPAAFD